MEPLLKWWSYRIVHFLSKDLFDACYHWPWTCEGLLDHALQKCLSTTVKGLLLMVGCHGIISMPFRHLKKSLIGWWWCHLLGIHRDWTVQGWWTLCVDWIRVALGPFAVIGGSQGCVGPWSNLFARLTFLYE